MMNLKQLEKYLTDNKAVFETEAHEEGFRAAKDALKYYPPEECAAVYVIGTDNGLAAMIVAAGRETVNTGNVEEALGCHVQGNADPKIIRQATGFEAGVVPVVGHGLPVLFDKSLTIPDFIYGSAGDGVHTLKIRPEDVIRLSRMRAFLG